MPILRFLTHFILHPASSNCGDTNRTKDIASGEDRMAHQTVINPNLRVADLTSIICDASRSPVCLNKQQNKLIHSAIQIKNAGIRSDSCYTQINHLYQRQLPLLSLPISASTRAWSANSASLARNTLSGGRLSIAVFIMLVFGISKSMPSVFCPRVIAR